MKTRIIIAAAATLTLAGASFFALRHRRAELMPAKKIRRRKAVE